MATNVPPGDDDGWAAVVAFRGESDRGEVIARLTAHGVTPEHLVAAVAGLFPEVPWGRDGAELAELDDVGTAVLWTEVGRRIEHARSVTATSRAESFYRCLRRMTLAKVAENVGIRKQAVHQAIQRLPEVSGGSATR